MGWLLGLAGLLLSGCFGAEALSQASAGYIGCNSQEIEITNDQVGFNQRSWDASCRGRTYHCSGVDRTGIACQEDRPAVTSASVPAAPTPPSSSAAPARSWQRFTAKDCGVSVLLPGRPEEERETVRTKTGPIQGYSATVDLGGAVASVGCLTLPKKTIAIEKALDGARDGALEEMGAELVTERDVEVGEFQGRDIRFRVNAEQGRMRVLHRGHEIVTMIVAPPRAFSNGDIKAFFDGIALVGPSDGGAP